MKSGVFACGFEADGIDFDLEISSICRRNKGDFLGGWLLVAGKNENVLEAFVDYAFNRSF